MDRASAICVESLQKSLPGALAAATAPMFKKFDAKVSQLFGQLTEQVSATNSRVDAMEGVQRE
eukprot:6560088-Pyramimonas_sp.AAC.1